MFDNSVRLVGFVGKDAEVKTTKTQREFTVLSLATTASWKDKNGDGYIRRTEWHKLIACSDADNQVRGPLYTDLRRRQHNSHLKSVNARTRITRM
jgi:hypothetical protein